MRYLDSLLKEINASILQEVGGTVFSAGLVRQVMHQGKMINENLSHQPIFFDCAYDLYFYHKLRTEDYEDIAGGLQSKKRAIANLDLIVFSKADADDFFKSQLQKLPRVDIQRTDYDSYRIIEQETGLKEYDFHKYVFSINYTLTYTLKPCVQLCD